MERPGVRGMEKTSGIGHPISVARHRTRGAHCGFGVAFWALAVLVFIFLSLAASPAKAGGETDQPTVIVAVGAPGEEDYGKEFAKWAELWRQASEKAGAKHFMAGLGPTNATTDRSLLRQALSNEPTNSTAELWLVLIGHGTFDGTEAKFNLRGPDLSATEIGRAHV